MRLEVDGRDLSVKLTNHTIISLPSLLFYYIMA